MPSMDGENGMSSAPLLTTPAATSGTGLAVCSVGVSFPSRYGSKNRAMDVMPDAVGSLRTPLLARSTAAFKATARAMDDSRSLWLGCA